MYTFYLSESEIKQIISSLILSKDKELIKLLLEQINKIDLSDKEIDIIIDSIVDI